MEEKINIEVDRLLEFLNKNMTSGNITIDPASFLDKCIGSIVANIIMGDKFVILIFLKIINYIN